MAFTETIKNHKKLILWSAAILVAAGFLVFSNQGLLKRLNISLENDKITEKINRQKEIKDSLENRIELLKTDLTEIERIARESYGMIKPGEKVFFIEKKKNDDSENDRK